MNAPSRVDRSIEHAGYYRDVGGLDAFVLHSTGEIVLRVGTVGAVEMPSELGRRVRDLLAHPGPTIIRMDSASRAWWTMLTGPVQHHLCDCGTFAMLSAVQVRIVDCGWPIRLPAPHHPSLRWLDGSLTDLYRPAPEDIVEAIRRCRGG